MGLLFSTQSNDAIKHENTELDFIQNRINSNDIFMFSKSTCFYCDKAKELLGKSKLDYRYIELDKNENCPNNDCTKITKALFSFTRFKTVPQIFINGVFIGGFTDLNQMISNGKLNIKDTVNKMSKL